MNTKMFFRWVLLVCLLIAAGLGCQLVDNIKGGFQMVSTGKAVATDIGALATQIMPAGIEETAQALVTEMDQSGIIETAQSAITENIPEMGETAQAFTTEVYTSPEEAPADIPIIAGETSAFIGSPKAVSYFVSLDLKDVLDFYKREMPNNGWQQLTAQGFTNENMAELHFEKGGRKAVLVITQVPFVGQTTVVITIEGE